LFVAEVASTVNENLLIENLLEKTTDPKERLVLLNQYLENFKGTVYRQTMFAEFEKTIHEASEAGEALTPQYLCKLYARLNEEYFGPEMVVDDFIKYEWARIPHFYRPFYVYKYATSYSAAVALSEGIRLESQGKASGNIQKYLEFLSMGNSLDPLDELKHAGVDFSTPEPVDRALDKFKEVLDEAEKCVELLLSNK
jgi:oligoendopeptidase F